MSFRWSEETTLKFVSKYVEHECLWNIKSPYYKNKQMKQSAYLDLEKTMNIPEFGEKEIKSKIKNIRSTYSQELKKIKDSKNSGAGTDTVYIPSVKWFSILDAVLRNLTSMLTQSESNLASNISHTDDTDTEQNSTLVDTFREPIRPPPPTKKKKIAQLSSMVSQLKEIADTTNSTVEENEFDVFGKHVGLQLKSLPLLLALGAQEHIQLYINRIRREHIQNEFDVFGKHVGLQLKSLPLLLALGAQEHIQLYINRIRREHIQNEFDVFGKHVGLQLKSLPLLLALGAQEHIQLYINRIRREHIQNASEQNRITRTPQSSHSAESPYYSDSSIYYNDNSNYNLEEQATECIYNNENETQSNVTVTSNDLIFTAMQNANVDNQK